MDIDLNFQESVSTFTLELESDTENFDPGIEEPTILTSNDHRLLTHRNDENQHSIGSISGLSQNLSTIENTSTRLSQDKLDISDIGELSNLEIKSLWDQLIT